MIWPSRSARKSDVELEAPRPRSRRARPDGSSFRDRFVITMTVGGVALFLIVGVPLLKRDTPAQRTDESLPVVDPHVSASDPDRDAVRSWLRAHCSDPHPRELRWWPARELAELHRRQLEAAKEAAEDDPQLEDLVAELQQRGPERVCRLKYRAQNETGAQVLYDDLFSLRGRTVSPLRSGSSLAAAARKFFTDPGSP